MLYTLNIQAQGKTITKTVPATEYPEADIVHTYEGRIVYEDEI